MSDKTRLSVVMFFERNEEGTFDCIGRTIELLPWQALEVYANTPNPASQLVEGKNEEELERNIEITKNNMLDPDYVRQEVDPYL